MFRIVLVILILTMLAGCGGSPHRTMKRFDAAPDPGAGYYDPGYDDGGYDDGATVDPGYDDGSYNDGAYVDPGYDDTGGDDAPDVSEEKASVAPDSVAEGTQVEAVNYDASAYVLYVEAGDPRTKWRRLYLPPVSAASPGSSARSTRLFRFRPGSPHSLVLETQDGRTLDVQALDASGIPSRKSFMIVGATLLASQS